MEGGKIDNRDQRSREQASLGSQSSRLAPLSSAQSVIPNHTSLLPKEYHSKSFGLNKETNLPKLFRGIILGPSGSGKSNLLIDFIKKSPNVYTHLHLAARQPEQPLYQYLKDKLGEHCTIYGPENPPDVDAIQKNGLQLVVFDDFSNDLKWCNQYVSPFFIRGRHKQLSVLFLAHAFHQGCPKMVRLNSEILMILRSPSKSDMKMVLKDMPISGLSFDQLWGYYQNTSAEKGQMLLINTLDQTVRYNWKRVLFDGLRK